MKTLILQRIILITASILFLMGAVNGHCFEDLYNGVALSLVCLGVLK